MLTPLLILSKPAPNHAVPTPETLAASTPPATGTSTPTRCYHCGLPVPPGVELSVVINKRAEPMCCHGCQAVARAIIDAGHSDFYRHRTAPSATGAELVPEFLRQTQVYDHPDVQKTFVRDAGDHQREASLILEGITCAACIWLNERHLAQLPGVLDVHINYATHRAQIRWDETRIRLSDILQAIHSIGYTAHPYDPQQQQQVYERERRRQLQRIGVAGVLGMQVMVLSIALYLGDWSGMEAGFRTFFRWIGLLLTTPVLLYSGAPFLRGAWRDLGNRSIGMDVPVALGILVAFSGSLHASWTGRGEVYYDSVVMFIFFLLVSRYFELMARKRGAETAERLSRSLPAMATRIRASGGSEEQEIIPAAELRPGDQVIIRAGETVPADGRIEDGASSVNEALLTGESTPLSKSTGMQLIGGSINIESPLRMTVEKAGMDTVLAEIIRLLEQAQNEKPAITRLADRAASWFVSAVILIAAGVGLYWWQQGGGSWLPVLVSVLVVTCPCALSLATPTAISAVTGNLLAHGLLTLRGHSLETLARSTHVVFDKTGTLTDGTPRITAIHRLSELDEAVLMRVAAALEARSEHPAGKAIAAAAGVQAISPATDIRNHPGAGVSGTVEGASWFIGNAAFIHAHCATASTTALPEIAHGIHVLLADSQRIHALFVLNDAIRAGAGAVVSQLQRAGKQVLLMSGDNAASARVVASAVGIDDVRADLKPAAKLQQVQALQQQGAVVVMVGDGINDAPVLAAADVSIAMQGAAHISQASADMILLSDRLGALADGIALANKAFHIIRQNLGWAISYNLIALPAAALGYVAPWMAAIGMSSSSLLVVINALRLTRGK